MAMSEGAKKNLIDKIARLKKEMIDLEKILNNKAKALKEAENTLAKGEKTRQSHWVVWEGMIAIYFICT